MKTRDGIRAMNIKKKLQNPFLLVAEGFAAGAIIFFATTPVETDLPQQAPSALSAPAEDISRA